MLLGHVLISSMKDEGPFALEWVAHHRVLGFDHIFVASNDCRDGTDLILAALARAGAIGHAPNVVAPGQAPQHAGYALLRDRFALNRADWLMVLDADEFLQVNLGAGRVQDLTDRAGPQVDVVALNALTFGTAAGRWRPGRVCTRFQRRLPEKHPANAMVKSIARAPGRFRHIHNHSLVGFKSDQPLVVMRADGSRFDIAPGIPMWRKLRNFPQRMIRHDMASFNHYAIKTFDSFDLRKKRGLGTAVSADAVNQRHTADYFDTIAAAMEIDTRILRYDAQVGQEIARLMALPGVAQAQTQAETAYAALIAAQG